jgi:hypothetical protein
MHKVMRACLTLGRGFWRTMSCGARHREARHAPSTASSRGVLRAWSPRRRHPSPIARAQARRRRAQWSATEPAEPRAVVAVGDGEHGEQGAPGMGAEQEVRVPMEP